MENPTQIQLGYWSRLKLTLWDQQILSFGEALMLLIVLFWQKKLKT